MNDFRSMTWASWVFAVPLLMGAKGGCSDDIKLGSDYAGAAGMSTAKGGNPAMGTGAGTATTGGNPALGTGGGTATTGGNPSMEQGGGTATTGGNPSMEQGGGTATTGGNPSMAQGGGSPTTGGNPSMAQGGGTATTGGAPNPTCDGYEDSDPGEEVTIRYVNASAAPIYVGRTDHNCADEPEFMLFNPADERRSFPHPNGLGTTPWEDQLCMSCESVQKGRPECPDYCVDGPLIEIDPGGTYDTSWLGVYFETEAMPAACYFDPRDVHATCSKVVAAPPGAYRIVGTAWSSFSCEEFSGCDCTVIDGGACLVDYAGVASGVPRQVAATLAYPSQKLVELRFE